MAEKAEKPVQQQVIQMTPEFLQSFMQAVATNNIDAIKTYIEESKKPSKEQLAKRARDKAHFQQLESDAKAFKELKQKNCTHIHPHAGKSHFFKMNVFMPNGAEGYAMMVCSRCEKKLQNFDENGKPLPLEDPLMMEFMKWAVIPSIAENAIG